MCAGVQNVSRPIERCQEMSQCTPTMANVTAATEHQTYQGAVSWLCSKTVSWVCCIVGVAIVPPRMAVVYTCTVSITGSSVPVQRFRNRGSEGRARGFEVGDWGGK